MRLEKYMGEEKYHISLAFLPLQCKMLRAALGERGTRGQGAASTTHGLRVEESSLQDMGLGQDAKQSHHQPHTQCMKIESQC